MPQSLVDCLVISSDLSFRNWHLEKVHKNLIGPYHFQYLDQRPKMHVVKD